MKFSYLVGLFALPACFADSNLLKFQEAMAQLSQVTRDALPLESAAAAVEVAAGAPEVCLKQFSLSGPRNPRTNAVCAANTLL